MPVHTLLFQATTSQGIISAAVQITDGVEFDFDSTGETGTAQIPAAGTPLEFDNINLLTNTSSGAQIRSLILQAVGGDVQISTNATASFPVTGGPVAGVGDKVFLAANEVLFWQPAFTDSTGSYPAFGANPFPTKDVSKLFLYSAAGAATLKIRAILKNP